MFVCTVVINCVPSVSVHRESRENQDRKVAKGTKAKE